MNNANLSAREMTAVDLVNVTILVLQLKTKITTNTKQRLGIGMSY
jgi:hypothetical protein